LIARNCAGSHNDFVYARILGAEIHRIANEIPLTL